MYPIYVSEGMVLGKRGVGEAHTFVAILTKELGLIKATARSARVEKSKLRYGLEPFTHGTFSFVKGKNEWRLTGVERTHNMVVRPGAGLAQRRAVGRVARLLLRLIHGAEPSLGLYVSVQSGFASLLKAEEVAEVEGIEHVLVLQILAHLGYIPHTPELTPFIEADFTSGELTQAAQAARAFLTRTINESLAATGL